mmetsp:Transcript_7736/g.7176  ORF Transcript_7736/g.7176 Transcript_7736/m.7176 type:complete len:83 (-) Transcript_7736:96-344(-)
MLEAALQLRLFLELGQLPLKHHRVDLVLASEEEWVLQVAEVVGMLLNILLLVILIFFILIDVLEHMDILVLVGAIEGAQRVV